MVDTFEESPPHQLSTTVSGILFSRIRLLRGPLGFMNLNFKAAAFLEWSGGLLVLRSWFVPLNFSAQLKMGPCFLLETCRQRLPTERAPLCHAGMQGRIFLRRASSEVLEMGLEFLAGMGLFQSGGCRNVRH